MIDGIESLTADGAPWSEDGETKLGRLTMSGEKEIYVADGAGVLGLMKIKLTTPLIFRAEAQRARNGKLWVSKVDD